MKTWFNLNDSNQRYLNSMAKKLNYWQIEENPLATIVNNSIFINESNFLCTRMQIKCRISHSWMKLDSSNKKNILI
jgi:hypothetical protein